MKISRFGTSVKITHYHFIVGSSQNRQFLFIVHNLHKTDILFKVNSNYLVSTSRLFPLLPMTFQSPSLVSLDSFFSFACLDRISNNCFSSIHCILVRSGETEILFHFCWPFKFSVYYKLHCVHVLRRNGLRNETGRDGKENVVEKF